MYIAIGMKLETAIYSYKNETLDNQRYIPSPGKPHMEYFM